MSSNTNTIGKPLPREMQQHTYSILRRVEEGHWWFVGRRTILRSLVESLMRTRKEPAGDARWNILDVGCGTGANLAMLSQFGNTSGVDVWAEAVSCCHERGLQNVKQAVAEDLPFADESFELVTALDVIEHLDDDIAGLREMRRVLRPYGRILLFVPACMFLWGVQDDVSHHRRRYTLPQLKEAVSKAGFEIEQASYMNITFFLPTLIGRLLMRVAGIKPDSEANVTPGFLNGILGKILGSESELLRHMNLPFGVSALCIARRID